MEPEEITDDEIKKMKAKGYDVKKVFVPKTGID